MSTLQEQAVQMICRLPEDDLRFFISILTRLAPEEQSSTPLALDEMDPETFHAMLQQGFDEAKAGLGLPLEEAFDQLLTGA